MTQIQEADLTSTDLKLAFDRLSVHVKTAFPTILPMEVFTIGGAMVVIVLGTRQSTHDFDVSARLLQACYEAQYQNIKMTFAELCAKTFNELKAERKADLGSGKWMNYGADMFLPSGMCIIYQFAIHTIGAEVIQKAREDNIILFQNDALLVRSLSFAQTIFQKLKRFAGNDQNDINAIVSHLVDQSRLQDGSGEVVLEYLKHNCPDDQRELQVKEAIFKQRLTYSLSG
jgi:hypothetical protein